MTEDEAKTKWCPFMQIGLTDERFATNRGHVLQQNEKTSLKCIGSECMAWRATDNEYPPSNATNVNHPLDAGLPAGYCGLAGK